MRCRRLLRGVLRIVCVYTYLLSVSFLCRVLQCPLSGAREYMLSVWFYVREREWVKCAVAKRDDSAVNG